MAPNTRRSPGVKTHLGLAMGAFLVSWVTWNFFAVASVSLFFFFFLLDTTSFKCMLYLWQLHRLNVFLLMEMYVQYSDVRCFMWDALVFIMLWYAEIGRLHRFAMPSSSWLQVLCIGISLLLYCENWRRKAIIKVRHCFLN